MENQPRRISGICLAVWLLAVMPAAAGGDFYRYINDEGIVVVDYRVPPEYVARGYEVLNDEGAVIRVVPRALTEQERQVADARQSREDEARAEAERLRQWDESLLLRYSTIADIEAARERALGELRIRVSILKSNKRSLKQQVETYQAQAADLERSGKSVELVLLRTIEDLQDDIDTTDRAMADRMSEIETVATAYRQDIDRFGMLLDMVEFRRALPAAH
jgi:chromosome segregation ATPase